MLIIAIIRHRTSTDKCQIPPSYSQVCVVLCDYKDLFEQDMVSVDG